MAKKKSYNPFKMWGSYVGLVIMPIITFIVELNSWTGTSSNETWVSRIQSISYLNMIPWSQGGEWLLLWAPLGFLIGWGIHALIRSLRK